MAITRLGQIGIGVQRYTFTSPKGDGEITRLLTFGIGGARAVFTDKPLKEEAVTRLLTYGIGGQRVTFVAKPIKPPDPPDDGFEVSGLGWDGHKKKKKKSDDWGKGWEHYTEPQTPFEPLLAHGYKEKPDYALMMAILEATEEKSLSFSVKVSILKDET